MSKLCVRCRSALAKYNGLLCPDKCYCEDCVQELVSENSNIEWNKSLQQLKYVPNRRC